jgi:hypothetical protein
MEQIPQPGIDPANKFPAAIDHIRPSSSAPVPCFPVTGPNRLISFEAKESPPPHGGHPSSRSSLQERSRSPLVESPPRPAPRSEQNKPAPLAIHRVHPISRDKARRTLHTRQNLTAECCRRRGRLCRIDPQLYQGRIHDLSPFRSHRSFLYPISSSSCRPPSPIPLLKFDGASIRRK